MIMISSQYLREGYSSIKFVSSNNSLYYVHCLGRGAIHNTYRSPLVSVKPGLLITHT